jgi:hypothetical protein
MILLVLTHRVQVSSSESGKPAYFTVFFDGQSSKADKKKALTKGFKSGWYRNMRFFRSANHRTNRGPLSQSKSYSRDVGCRVQIPSKLLMYK